MIYFSHEGFLATNCHEFSRIYVKNFDGLKVFLVIRSIRLIRDSF